MKFGLMTMSTEPEPVYLTYPLRLSSVFYSDDIGMNVDNMTWRDTYSIHKQIASFTYSKYALILSACEQQKTKISCIPEVARHPIV